MVHQSPITPEAIEEFYGAIEASTRAVRRWVAASIGRKDEVSIWLHDYGAFGRSYFQYALYLSTLVMLYDRIYWWNPASTLLIPEILKDDEGFDRLLRPFGVDESFPDLLGDMIRAGIVVPVGSRLNYSLPIESEPELIVYKHLIEVPEVDYSQLDGYEAFCASLSSVSHTTGFPKEAETYEFGVRPSEILDALILHKAFQSSTVFASNEYARRIWEVVFGLQNRDGDIDFVKRESDSIDLCNRFLERVVLKCPQVMNSEELCEIRERFEARKMREWLLETYEKAGKKVRRYDPMEAVVQEFNELAKSHGQRFKLQMIDFTLSAVVGSFGALLGGVPGAVVGAAGTLFVQPELRKRLARYIGSYNWTVSLCDIRKKHRLAHHE
jgi:hypothetical protein